MRENGREYSVLGEWLRGRAQNGRGGLSLRYKIMANIMAVLDRKQAWREKHA